MPRGAIPTPRSELAASEPYQLDAGEALLVPSGEFPTPNHELVAAQPYRAGSSAAPEAFIAWPVDVDSWGDDKPDNASWTASNWAEEAFAKACADPRVFVPADVVQLTLQECGTSNFAAFVQQHGFQMDRAAYLDGPFNSVDWTNATALNSAIANLGPVKVGVASASLFAAPRGQVTPGTSGWATSGLQGGEAENHTASLFGYAPLAVLVDLFQQHGVSVRVPSGMPSGLCYAMFTWGSVGIVDQQSLINITGEAWVRNPTTIVRNLSG
jgi:hypothetical protein